MPRIGVEAALARVPRWAGAVVAAVALLLGFWLLAGYVAPGILSADSGELQLVARDLGVAHPPGYPLYTMAAHVFGAVLHRPPFPHLLARAPASVPDGDGWAGLGRGCLDEWAWSVSLFSAFLAVLTAAVVFATGRLLAGTAAGLLAAAVLVGSPTFLAQATTANIRMPTALLTAAVLLAAHRLFAAAPAGADGKQPAPARAGTFVALAILFGLAVGHHPSLVVLALPLAATCLVCRRDLFRQPKTLVAALAGFALSLAPILYLPLRDRQGAVLAPGTLGSLRPLVEHISGYGFRGDMLQFVARNALLDRLGVIVAICRLQFGLAGLALAVAGAAWLLMTPRARSASRCSAVLLASTVLLVAALALTYRAPQTSEYLMSAYVAIALLIGASSGVAAQALQPARAAIRQLAALSFAVLLAVFPLRAAHHAAGLVAETQPGAELDRALGVLASDVAPDGTVVLANWHYVTALWYAARHVYDRPALSVRYVAPAGAEPLGETLRRSVEEVPGTVILTQRSEQLLSSDTPLWPIPPGPFDATRPLATMAQGEPAAAGLDSSCRANLSQALELGRFADGPVYAGRLRLRAAEAAPTGDDGLDLFVRFEVLRPITESLRIAAQLVDANGAVWAQMDHAPSAGRWNEPAGLGDRLHLVVFRAPEGELPPALWVAVSVYRMASSGPQRLVVDSPLAADDAVRLGPLPEPWRAMLAAGRSGPGAPRSGEIPFGNAMTLAGYRVRRQGAELVVDLEWRADRAFVTDYTVSVQVAGSGWRAQHDGTPALGALPTLKWLPGMTIHDRHRIALPAEHLAEADGAEVSVAVYDAFRLEPLPVTDADRARTGQGLRAVLEPGP